jgi:uncharacterized protein YacL
MQYIILTLLVLIVLECAYLINKSAPRTKSRGHPVFLDTSVLMDGRIALAASTGFVPSNLVVPRSVLAELQLLADTADSEKRARARRGLDVVSELQAMPAANVTILDDGATGSGGVDERLVDLASKRGGSICTIDYNLNKVAKAQNIFVLNINELAQSLRMAVLPGERLTLELTQKGQDAHQAVGHLADGTMVVVEHAADLIGKSAEIECIRSIQTAAGRMLFAKLVSHSNAPKKTSKAPAGKSRPAAKPAASRSSRSRPRPASGRSHEDNLLKLVDKQ